MELIIFHPNWIFLWWISSFCLTCRLVSSIFSLSSAFAQRTREGPEAINKSSKGFVKEMLTSQIFTHNSNMEQQDVSSNKRWASLAILFFVNLLNYMDRYTVSAVLNVGILLSCNSEEVMVNPRHSLMRCVGKRGAQLQRKVSYKQPSSLSTWRPPRFLATSATATPGGSSWAAESSSGGRFSLPWSFLQGWLLSDRLLHAGVLDLPHIQGLYIRMLSPL